MAKGEINAELVRKLSDLLDEQGLTEIEYATGTWRIRVARNHGAAPAAASASGTGEAAPETGPRATVTVDAGHPGAVASPMVGTVYLAPEPDAAPFVKPGDKVSEGQTLLLIEAMKTFNEIRAPRAGEVKDILVESGAPVEYGDVLLILE